MNLFKLSTFSGKLILIATIIASGMGFLDGSVVNIAIPSIQKNFSANISEIQWVVNSYLLMLSALILISGSLGDKFGVKRIFSIGIIVFTVFSFLCGLSTTVGELILFRALQGIGAAMMVPGSLSILSTMFDNKEHGKVIGYWSGFSGGIAALGPLLGGYLVQIFGWPSIFFINVPLGILALLITFKYIPHTKFNENYKIDFLGTILIFFSLLLFSYGLIQQPTYGWSQAVISSLTFGVMLFVIFVFWQFKFKNPLIPLTIFKNQLVSGANLATLFLYGALSAVLFFVVLNLQQIQHLSPLFAGLGLLPTVLLITFLSGPSGTLADKIGPRLPMIIGPFIVGIGMGSFALAGSNANYFISFLPGLTLFGLGMALVIAPLTKSALSVDPKYSGSASGINNAVARVAGLLTVALLGAIVAGIFSSNMVPQIYSSNLTNDQKEIMISRKDQLAGISIPANFDDSSKIVAQKIIDDSFIKGFKVAMLICAFFAFISSFVSFLTIKNKS